MLYLTRDEALARLRTSCAEPVFRSIEAGAGEVGGLEAAIDLGDQVGRYCYLSHLVTEWLSPFVSCTLLMTEFGIWPSRENMHLLRRLRASYSELRGIGDAPGHFFFATEASDLTTHLHIGLVFGWGGVLANDQGKVVRFSHDDWIAFAGEGGDAVVSAWNTP